MIGIRTSARRTGLALAAACTLAIGGCGGSDVMGGPDDRMGPGMGPAPPGSQRPADVVPCYSALADGLPATQDFLRVLADDDTQARSMALSALNTAVQAHKSEEELALLLGLGSLWRLAAPRDDERNDTVGTLLAAVIAKNELTRAYKLCPTDYRIPAWLGPVLVNIGRNANDQASIDQGMAVLNEGIAHYPAFVLFAKLLIYADRPRSDPDFQQAVQAVTDNIRACGDMTTTTDPACKNTPRVPHNIEGGQLFLGDVYTKAGRTDDARAAYQRLMASPDYAAWPFQSLLRDRLATLDDRVKAFADSDPKNDPESAWSATYECSICHKR